MEDKVHFIFNNVSAQNMDIKVKELVGLVKEEFYPWLAQYIVVKRVALEQNFQQMYISLLEKVNSQFLGSFLRSSFFVLLLLRSNYHSFPLFR